MSQTCTCNTCGRTEHNQLLVWNKCEQCQRIEHLEKRDAAQAATIAQLREALEQIASLGLTISESEYSKGYNKAMGMVQSFAARALKGRK